jgi:Holliday junction resolvase RusA-like endonuclease
MSSVNERVLIGDSIHDDRGAEVLTQVFVVMGPPKPQGRPRACRRGAYAGVYEDNKDKGDKNNIRAQIVTQRPKRIPMGTPVALAMVYYMPRPKMHYSRSGQVKPRFIDVPHVARPDCDNMEKKFKDALSGMVWHDDSQVVSVYHRKCYCEPDKFPRTEITVLSW